MKYKKIEENDVYKILVGTSLDFMNPIGGAMSLTNIASSLKTSRYQVKKHMDQLKEKQMVELRCFNLNTDEDLYPPYWGYLLTEKGKDTDYYKEKNEEMGKIIEECFS